MKSYYLFYLIYIIIAAGFFFNKPSLFTVGFCAGLITLLIVFFWYIFGKDRHVTPVVNFYPPKNLNAAEVGVIYSEKITKNNYCAFFMQLEQEGYIKISSDKDKEMKVDKLKDYTGINKNIKQYMNDLSDNNNKHSANKNCHTPEANYYKNLKKFKDRLFNEISTSVDIMAPCVISFLLLVNLTVYSLFDQSGTILNILNFICIVSIPIAIKGIKRKYMEKSISRTIHTAIIIIILLAICIGAPFFMDFEYMSIFFATITIFALFGCAGFVAKGRDAANHPIPPIIYPIIFFISILQLDLPDYQNFISPNFYVFLIFCITISLICLYNMPQKNNYAQKLQGEVLGFRKFLLTVEKPILEKLLKEDKDYCNKMLPYAYSLMIADKWIEKVKKLVNIDMHYIDITDIVSMNESHELLFIK